MLDVKNIKYSYVKEPNFGVPEIEPEIPDEVYKQRLNKTLDIMELKKLDYLIFYADREHFSNFDYLTGFSPRFEEGILILNKKGNAHVLLGNECFNLHKYSRIPVEGVLYHALSLPNQPIYQHKDLKELLCEAGVKSTDKLGLVGWKLMYPIYGERYMFDVPSFIVDSAREIAGTKNVINVTDLFIHPGYGIRTINTAHDIAAFEYGAAYASDSVQQILINLRTGINEIELSQFMTCGAIPTSVFPKVISGDRMDIGMISPTTNEIKLGDRFQVSVGLRGGLTCRKGFVAYSEDDLPDISKDYLQKIAAPYYATVVNWYQNMGIGVSAGDIYSMIETSYLQEKYGWSLNPGHFIATEEWMSSPFYENSNITIKSGMCIQMDIIPTADRHYTAPNCEDGVAICDAALRKEIELKYPDVYKRIQRRRDFMINVLNIKLRPEILPLSNLIGLYRPFMLNKDKAFIVEG